MYDLILIISTLVCFAVASVMDVKKREIADYISGFLAIFSLLVRMLWFFTELEISAIFPMVIVAPVTLAVSYIAYKKNLWGGGDVKLLSAASVALTGFPENIFFHHFIVNLLFAGAFYGALYSMVIVVKNRKEVARKEIKKSIISSVISIIIISSLILIDQTINPARVYKQLIYLFVIFAFLALAYPFAKIAEEKFFYKKRKTELLTEGDWLAEDIKKYGKVIIKNKTTLEKKHLQMLKNMGIKEIMIKEGIPFVPSFLAALVVTVFFNGVLMNLLFGI